MKKYRILTVLTATLFLAVLPAHRARGATPVRDPDYGPVSCTCSDKGEWPGTWPKELEPFRAQAHTFFSFKQILEAVHEIRFTNRADFERVWPVLLKLKTPGAPLTLYLTDSPPPGRMGVLFAKGVPVVRIYAPDETYVCYWLDESAFSRDPMAWNKKLLKEGRMVKCGPPWPAEIVRANGGLPEWVTAIREVDGKLRWTAADIGAVLKEIKDSRVPAPLAVDGFVHRARIDLDLVADGQVIDLDKLQFPPETVTHDSRIKIPKPSAEQVKETPKQ